MFDTLPDLRQRVFLQFGQNSFFWPNVIIAVKQSIAIFQQVVKGLFCHRASLLHPSCKNVRDTIQS